MQLFKQISWYFVKEWKRYLGSMIILIIIAILQLLPPKLVGILVDCIINKKQYGNNLFLWILLIFLTSIIIYILRYIWRVLLFGAAYKLAIQLRIKLYSYLSKKNSTFYLKYRTGDLMARATNDVDKVVFAAGEGVLTLIDSIITGCSVFTVMITQINWKLTIISLLPMPIMAILITQCGKKLYIAFKEAQKNFSDLNNQTQESLKNIYVIKGFGLEKYEIKKFKKIAKETSKKNIVVSKIDAQFEPIIYCSIILSNLLAISSGSYLVWNKYITIGQLTSFIMYLSLMVWPMLSLSWMFNIVERGGAAWNRIQQIINYDLCLEEGKERIQEPFKSLNINISKFFYPKKKITTLKNIFITIQANEIIGICGPTGGGKSTLLHLIQKKFDVTKGTILYNTSSIYNFTTKEWRKKLSIVNQTTFLFSDTIANNISLGDKKYTQKQIEYVCHLSCIHEEILSLPQGYQSKIGEKGIILSGGQKQRIALARALITNAEILILDNSLSAIDIITQNKILQNIKLWKQNKHTIIILSHELFILKNSDNIFIIKNGSIENYGKHNELIKQKNWYSKMYNFQQNHKIMSIKFSK
ncbi:Multidrug resistance-like ATP-binding protein MdlA [Buchnera aphidicola (Pterocallis alni)]|uniref:ABC transporter transmembrane domain-containing protein n=1 Tax=Buchnera aphidicola TaxID=9 RepID=UPI003463D45C